MVDLSGLGSFASLNDDFEATGDNLLDIDIDMIDESPNIGRPHYDQKKLEELAESIRERGVKAPISVHRHPSEEGRYIVNYGHRRLRASKIAGKSVMPAIVDEDFDELDQAVENIQREDLEAAGIAAIIAHAIQQGKSKSEIAERLGKPNSFVSDHAMFFKLSDDVRSLYEEGYCTSMRILAMFQRAYNKWPVEVTEYCREESDFTAAAAARLTDRLKEMDAKKKAGPSEEEDLPGNKDQQGDEEGEGAGAALTGQGTEEAPEHGNPVAPGKVVEGSDEEAEKGAAEKPQQKGEGRQKGPGSEEEQPPLFEEAIIEDPRVVVSVHGLADSPNGGRVGELVMRPSDSGTLWVQFEDDGSMELVKSTMVVIENIKERY